MAVSPSRRTARAAATNRHLARVKGTAATRKPQAPATQATPTPAQAGLSRLPLATEETHTRAQNTLAAAVVLQAATEVNRMPAQMGMDLKLSATATSLDTTVPQSEGRAMAGAMSMVAVVPTCLARSEVTSLTVKTAGVTTVVDLAATAETPVATALGTSAVLVAGQKR
jgi:hypothetical protein